ncbi:MAG: methionine gamma-lyase family protein [Clostridiales Family XIII bacterium]|jgi:cystathionine beta-lyase family protein involved in aluminum resistance|nr:methionine gamma-lyase family protein [Clostridiales Family XIII bacterium]
MMFDDRITALAREAERAAQGLFAPIEAVAERNLSKVLGAFRANRLSDTHFGWATGYGYDDAGRAVTEKIFADVFGAEAALVRTQIVNGTHAIALCFFGVLRPGEKLLYCTGAPYDTLRPVIGNRLDSATTPLRGSAQNDNTGGSESSDAGGRMPPLRESGNSASDGSLADFGVGYAQADLAPDGGFDWDGIAAALADPTVKMAAIQRATGYSDRPALTMDKIAAWARFVRARRPDVVLFCDNCYGEFLDVCEPTRICLDSRVSGVDLIAGSLIKNPGGGLALSGGYVAGKKEMVDKISFRLTCPGIGGDCGLTFGQTRTVLQGLFLAPRTVADAVKGAILCGKVFETLGYRVFPKPAEPRSDIVQAVEMGSPEALVAFCEGIMAASPVDSFVTPEPWDMPGYADKVVMASGAFVTGSSIELSADGPLRPPYNVYFQGGLVYEHAKIGIQSALQRLLEKGLLEL